ncbi:hypothetical protein BDW02DRAFT_468387, partial [Decorospora gaudefroyi]
MEAIPAAIEATESRDPEEDFPYRKVAEQFNVDRTTLSRHYKGAQASRAGAASKRQYLTPQQEEELVQYIEGL